MLTTRNSVKYVYVDVTSIPSQVEMLQNALSWVPQGTAIDSLIACAGVNGNPFDLSPEDPSELPSENAMKLLSGSTATMQINLINVVQMVQLVVKYGMGLKSPSTGPGLKSVTLIGSLASYRALPRAVDYSAAKWGIRGAFRSLRQQLPQIGVRTNIVAPGFVKTPLIANTIQLYEGMGVKFVEKKDVVDAVEKVVTDSTLDGRSFGVSSEGVVDLGDDKSGKDSFEAVDGLVSRGALGEAGCPMGNDDLRAVTKP